VDIVSINFKRLQFRVHDNTEISSLTIAAAERYGQIKNLCTRSNLRVHGYSTLECGCPFSSPRENIAVCSYEKGNSAVNRLISTGHIGDLCCVIIDEFHMLVEPGRGAALEVRRRSPLHT
jgi:replicative superfamily II helicase